MPYLKVLKFSKLVLLVQKNIPLPKGWCTFQMLQLEFGKMSPSVYEAQVLVEV